MTFSVSLGGLIATTPEEIEKITFCVCNDRFDVKFISMWWNNTYRVCMSTSLSYHTINAIQIVNRRFIFDCASKRQRVSEESYSWGVDVDREFEIVPTWAICDWSGPMLPKKAKAGEKRKVPPALVQPTEVPTPTPRPTKFKTGLLTPAPSIDSQVHRKRKKVHP
ncbi:hypothetical protein B0H13DRAFT_2352060 [Mycena leptocephala]|nr:hypothetical protein B0H13DRAFT_2352060 [Mycena leptocephala]